MEKSQKDSETQIALSSGLINDTFINLYICTYTEYLQDNISSKTHLSRPSVVCDNSEAKFPTQSKAIGNRTSPRFLWIFERQVLSQRLALSPSYRSAYKNKIAFPHGAQGMVATPNLHTQ